MKTFIIFCREEKDKLAQIIEHLKLGEKVVVHNEHETFYGTGFERWLTEGLSELTYAMECTEHDQFYGYGVTFEITLLS